MPVARVVLDAPNEQRHPSGENQDFAVLFQGDALPLQGCDAAKPRPALHEELVGRHERVLRAEPVSHDPQAVKRRLVQVKSRNYSETVWKPALVKAGIIAKPVKDRRSRARYVITRKEGIHQLRHYFASVMLVGGVSIKEVAEYLGHADPASTLRVYAHLLPSSHDRAQTVINDHFRLLRPEQPRNSIRS